MYVHVGCCSILHVYVGVSTIVVAHVHICLSNPQVLFRLNLLSVLVSLTLGRSYGAYSLPLLLTLGFMFTTVFMASWPKMTPASRVSLAVYVPPVAHWKVNKCTRAFSWENRNALCGICPFSVWKEKFCDTRLDCKAIHYVQVYMVITPSMCQYWSYLQQWCNTFPYSHTHLHVCTCTWMFMYMYMCWVLRAEATRYTALP